jgi:hypothetical protein
MTDRKTAIVLRWIVWFWCLFMVFASAYVVAGSIILVEDFDWITVLAAIEVPVFMWFAYVIRPWEK